MNKIGFAFTNYNNSNYTIDLVKSINEINSKIDCEIVIIDNNSNAKEQLLLSNLNIVTKNLEIIFNNENLGYFAGLNIGIEHLRNKPNPANIIVVGNNDLLFSLDFIQNLLDKIELFKIYPVISPNIITLDGIHQNPHALSKPSLFREIIFDLYYSSYISAIIIKFIANKTKLITGRTDHKEHPYSQPILLGYGACYILGPIFFQDFKLLWSPTFLMGEEFFLSKQLKSKSHKIYYESTIVVNHHDHASVGKIPKKSFWKISKKAHIEYRKHSKLFSK